MSYYFKAVFDLDRPMEDKISEERDILVKMAASPDFIDSLSAYFKGVSIHHLSKRFELNRKEVEYILEVNDIPIVSKEESKPPRGNYYRRGKR